MLILCIKQVTDLLNHDALYRILCAVSGASVSPGFIFFMD